MAVEQVSDWRVVNFPAVPVPGRRYNKKGASETRYRPALTDSAGNLIQLDAPTVLELTNALALKQDLIAAGTTAQYWRGDKTWQALDKAAVGLGNVDNTSDLLKPLSTATINALALKANDADVVKLTGNQNNINGIKTFIASPVVPNASNANQAVAYGQMTTADAALQTQIDSLNTTAASGLKYKGDINASTNPNYPAGVVGDTYIMSTAGKIGGASGIDVEPGDMIINKVASAAGNQATVGANWTAIQSNIGTATETVQGYSRKATTAEAAAGTSDVGFMTALKTAQFSDARNVRFDAAQSLTTPQKTQAWSNLGIAFGSTAGSFVEGNDARLNTASAGANRWIKTTAASNYDTILEGGVNFWNTSTANKPSHDFGSTLTFVAVSPTGDHTASSWANQISAGTNEDWYVRVKNGTAAWGANRQIWTSKQFTQTNINNWNAAATAALWNGGADPEW